MLKKTIPPARSVAIITNNVGCERHVQYYSTLEKYLDANNWTVTENFDVEKLIICACGFHDFMMEKVSKLLLRLSEIGYSEQDVIITGCLPKTHEQLLQQQFRGELVEINQEHRLDELLGATVPFRNISPPNVFVRPQSWQVPQDKRFFIKIEQGCSGHCTYCVIKKAKGDTKSVPLEEIKKQFEYAVTNGYKEIYLMGEDTFAWGMDLDTTIIKLIDSLLEISADVLFIFGNWHSHWLPKFSEDIIRLYNIGVMKRLSIGLQHVNEFLLRRMGRSVNFKEFYAILQRLRAECPDLHLSADIMVGFPGETPEMFEELIEFFEQDKVFDLVAHFGYSDVQGAPSSKLTGKVDPLQVGRRWDRLKKTLGKRSYYNTIEEPDTDRAVFQLSLDHDYIFCKDTYLKESK